MPYLVEVVERGEPVTLAYPDAEIVSVESGALILSDALGAPLAGHAKWLTFRRVTPEEMATYREVGS